MDDAEKNRNNEGKVSSSTAATTCYSATVVHSKDNAKNDNSILHRCMDSTRYFVLKLSSRQYIGIAFNGRDEATTFYSTVTGHGGDDDNIDDVEKQHKKEDTNGTEEEEQDNGTVTTRTETVFSTSPASGRDDQQQFNETSSSSWWADSEAYFFNHGANLGFWTLTIATNVAMFIWGVWQFTAPWWTTPNDVLRITLPIARGAGRLVTWNWYV